MMPLSDQSGPTIDAALVTAHRPPKMQDDIAIPIVLGREADRRDGQLARPSQRAGRQAVHSARLMAASVALVSSPRLIVAGVRPGLDPLGPSIRRPLAA